MEQDHNESIVRNDPDPLIRILNKILVFCVRCLAVLMVLVILWSTFDVVVHLYRWFVLGNSSIFAVESLLPIFGAFLAVLIGIEIFLNIVFYLKRDAIHLPLVLATALTAISRKVIILDYNAEAIDHYMFGIGVVILSVGITYWLITKKE